MQKSLPLTVELTKEETELLSKISFGHNDHEVIRKSCAAAAPLAKSILSRRAVPEIRLRYFTDAEFNIGSKKSRKAIFESKGTIGENILNHGHFLPYLRYFIFGPNLPQQAIASFCAQAYSSGYVSGGDVEALRKEARTLTRHHNLVPKDASEEFFKLALECGMEVSYARSIRDAVRAIR
jgi:hypothetical protein